MSHNEHISEQLHNIRHSLSHIMAQAVQRVQQADVEIAIGPAIDNGFYYDFLFSPEKQIKDEDLQKVQDAMVKIVKEGQTFTRLDVSNEESEHIVKDILKQKYKAELRDEFAAAGEGISFYLNSIPMAAKENLLKGVDEDYVKYYEGVTAYFQKEHPAEFADRFITFLDMCEGPHVESMKEIDPSAFKVAKIAGAYRRGDEKNVMMTRLYAYAFEQKEELKEYLNLLEEARQRDHRKLGKELWIFMVNDLVGKGLPMYLPNGYIVWSELEEYIKEKERDLDYQHVLTPPMGSVELYKTSGHWDHYKDSMFPAMEVENETFVLRPMNCPHHMMIYKEGLHSYRDLPIRIGEIARDMRFEASGTLKGIERVRCFCQNDAHLFVTPEQIKEEFEKVVKLILDVYKDFNITNYEFRLSLRDPEDKEKYYPDDEMWNTAEDTLRKVLNEIGITYQEEIGEAAFYGPKLDVQVKPAVGNEYTISTCQLDFCLPQRFELAYTDSQGNKQTPVVLHRAILGSIDRFIAYILEETKGIFPFWLTPEQVRIITVADAFLPYAEQVKKQLRSEKFRVSIDEGNDSFSKKIRNAEVQKVPYILIVGEKEEKAGSVSVREFKTKEQYELDVKEFVEKISVIRDEKRL